MQKVSISSIIIGGYLIASCVQPDKNLQFTKLDGGRSGIDFVNQNQEKEGDNILTYEYFYNGGGVAVGDINNDGLPDLYFSSNQGDNALYLNKGNLKFEDISDKARVKCSAGWKAGVAMADVNNDGWLDIYVCRSKDPNPTNRKNLLYINNGNLTFTEKASEFGLDDNSYSTQAAFFDFDNDGDLDVFLLNHSLLNISNGFIINPRKYQGKELPPVSNKLLVNVNGQFKDASQLVGLKSNASNFGLGVALSDVNQDGFIDIYTSCDYTGSDKLWINQKGLSMHNAADSLLSHISLFSMGCDISDLNNDTRPDIITLDMMAPDNERQKQLFAPDRYEHFQKMIGQGLHYQYMRNMVHLNYGNGQFSEVGQWLGLSATDWSWAALAADYDNDGWTDLFISNSFKRDFTNNDFLKYRADQQLKKRDRENESLYKALVDKMPSHPFQNFIFKNRGDLHFEDKSIDWGFDQTSFSNGAAYADLDNDGDLDIITNNLNQPASIYRNNSEKLSKKNYLTIKLKGVKSNKFGIGCKVYCYSNGQVQFRELLPVRGFMSSVEPCVHFGLSETLVVDSVIVNWPSGSQQIIKAVKSNQSIKINEDDNFRPSRKTENSKYAFFEKTDNNIAFRHHENTFIDFKVQSLLPRMYSTEGPAMAIADVNGDGKEDVFFGGAKGQPSELWLKRSGNKYQKANVKVFEKDSTTESVDAVFFDADGDGDNDLYVAAGGYEFSINDIGLRDHLYVNDSHGNFISAEKALPNLRISKSCVRPADIDADGDIDLFLGGRIVPGHYPQNASSTILINDGHGFFSDQTKKYNTDFSSLGLITDAVWIDLNSDAKPDLITVGEWQTPRVFINTGKLEERTASYFKESTFGWWNCIVVSDVDQDGDLDLIAGNFGMNNLIKPSGNQPVTIVHGDFDSNGSVDPILSYYIQGKSYPYATRDELADQLPFIKKKFPDFESYSHATIESILSKSELQKANHLKATTFESMIFINQQNKFFEPRRLPAEAQWAPMFSIAVADVNSDGHQDLITGGNLSATRVRTGKLTGNLGFVFLGDGKGNFRFVQPTESGITFGNNDIRKLRFQNGYLIAAVNNSSPLIFKLINSK